MLSSTVILISIVMLILVVVISYRGAKRVAWSDKMRRLHAGMRDKAEWMAPDYVLQHVRADYLAGVRWLRDHASAGGATENDLEAAEIYFDGEMLESLRKRVTVFQRGRVNGQGARYGESYHSQHYIDVRQFSDDGETCYLIDHQTEVLIELIDLGSQRVISRQRLEPSTQVYRMRYNKTLRRWKIDQFVQEFAQPYPINSVQSSVRIALVSTLPRKLGPNEGRDH